MQVINNKKYGDLKIFTKFAFGIYYAIAFFGSSRILYSYHTYIHYHLIKFNDSVKITEVVET